MAVAGGWREAAAAPWGKGCCSPLSPEMGKPDVGRDGSDGAVAVGDPMERVGMLLADPPALSNSERMGEQEGGGNKSPQQQRALGCARPLSKQNTAGRAALGLHILARVRFGWRSRFHPVYPSRRLGAAAFRGSSHCESAASQGYREGRGAAVGGSGSRQSFPAELIRAVLLADAPMAPGDGGYGMHQGVTVARYSLVGQGSSVLCGVKEGAGMAAAVPAQPPGRSRDGSMGFFCGSLGWDPPLEQCCPASAKSAPGSASPPCPGDGGASIPCTRGPRHEHPGAARDGCYPSPASSPCRTGSLRAPISRLHLKGSGAGAQPPPLSMAPF